MGRVCLYFRKEPEPDRWLPGDRYIRPLIRRLLRGPQLPGGVERVFLNLCKGLDRIGVAYEVNPPFSTLQPGDRVGVLGRGRYALEGYDKPNPILAGIALMTHPSEWPTLFDDYPVARYLQHSSWAAAVYVPWYGDKVGQWAVGIDTQEWAPSTAAKTTDFLIYDKFHWDQDARRADMLEPIKAELTRRGLTYEVITYGSYKPDDFKAALSRSRAMLFLCEHESQGIAYQECLSSGVPVLAWDNGWCLDPNRFDWGQPDIPTSSVPFFSKDCGETFESMDKFSEVLDRFLERWQDYRPRDYILSSLTLEASARHFLAHLEDVQGSACAQV
jgi:hypothetical protein